MLSTFTVCSFETSGGAFCSLDMLAKDKYRDSNEYIDLFVLKKPELLKDL
jgi:hypothetical protein